MSTITRAFALAFHALTPAERSELKRLVSKLLLAVVAATGLLTWFVVVPAMNQAGGPTPPTTAADEVKLPPAPQSPDGRTTCPKGWNSTPGTIPPDAVSQLPQTHVGARSFYTCRKDTFEIIMLDNGYVYGYEGNNPLSPEDARRALTR